MNLILSQNFLWVPRNEKRFCHEARNQFCLRRRVSNDINKFDDKLLVVYLVAKWKICRDRRYLSAFITYTQFKTIFSNPFHFTRFRSIFAINFNLNPRQMKICETLSNEFVALINISSLIFYFYELVRKNFRRNPLCKKASNF